METILVIVLVWGFLIFAATEFASLLVYGPFIDGDHPVIVEALKKGNLNPFASQIISARDSEGFVSRRTGLFSAWNVSWNGYSQGRVWRWSYTHRLLEDKHRELLKAKFTENENPERKRGSV